MRSAKWICKCDSRWSQKIELSSSLLESSTPMGAAVDIPSVSRCGSIPATLGKRLACRAMDRLFQTETIQNISIRDNWQMMFETAAIGMMMMMIDDVDDEEDRFVCASVRPLPITLSHLSYSFFWKLLPPPGAVPMLAPIM